MPVSVRAAVAVALLAALPALPAGLLGGLAALEIVAFTHSIFLGAKLFLLTVPLGVALVRGLFALERPVDEPVNGIPVTPAAQPELWALVTRLAGQVGTRAPDEILVTAEANASVTEQTRLLGLRVLRRRMFIGAPLLAGFTEPQLAAVLAHELAHYGNADTRLAGLTYRAQRAMVRAIAHLDPGHWLQRLVGKLFFAYAKVFFRISNAVCRRQELAADEASARIAGPCAAASALREVPVLDTVWHLFLNNYATLGWRAGYLPARFFDGFAAILADPEMRPKLAEIRADPADDAPSAYDSHPPLAARIAALEALPPGPPRNLPDRPARELLRDGEALLDAALLDGLVDEAHAKHRVGWAELVHLGCRDQALDPARALLDAAGAALAGPPTLGTLLDALDAGRLVELSPPDARPAEDAGPRARRALARLSVRTGLSTVVTLALADVGAARWELSWSAPAEPVVGAPYAAGLEAALDAAVAEEPDTSPLRATLAAAGVGLDYRPTREPVATPVR
ncbi:M48 family metallopeptidase [Amycolatopsis anabasis]|uniref:M48 family metallopeptidase n=1 Tax=Amycolatopsis anabasis TaxID=1840409 RepID=UPI00131E0DB7|nr:M48 family metallopeptidase [Amycolatopsis anabasis]